MAETDPSRGRRWRLSIAVFQGLLLGGVLLVSMAGVLGVTLYATFRNTAELLEDKSRLLLSSLASATRRHLDAAGAQLDYLAGLIEAGRLDPDDPRFAAILEAGLAATPQVNSVVFIDPRGWSIAALREPNGAIRSESGNWANDPEIALVMADARARVSSSAFWGPPVYSRELGPILNLRRPVRRAGQFLGLVAAVLSISDFSTFIASLETETGQNAFVLYRHDYVLAHRALESPFPGLGPERPLPKVTEIGDPVLFGIWSEGWQGRQLDVGSGHSTRLGDVRYIILYTPLGGYGDAPWLVGSYFREDQIGRQVSRMAAAAVAGVAGLVLAMALAFALGRAVRMPVTRLARAANLVRALALDQVPTLPPSRFRELDEAAAAFNAMVAALRAFAAYVPKRLVSLLIARGDVLALPSETREVTVLFTDIAGFTARTEQLGADATATFLNHHFTLLTTCIEAEGGVVDKYIGDAVMALWNAVEEQPDHAARAARAAHAIATAIRDDNREREHPVRVRIGLHSGPVVVGNIGTAARMNYTVVGDTVNVAQRLEAMAKEMRPEAEVAILLSAATAGALGPGPRLSSLGWHRLRGRDAPTEIFAL